MYEATSEEDLLVRFPICAVRTTDGSLLLSREMIHPYCIVFPQGGYRVVQEQAPITSVAVSQGLEKQTSFAAKRLSIV